MQLLHLGFISSRYRPRPPNLTDTLGFDEPETKCSLKNRTATKGSE